MTFIALLIDLRVTDNFLMMQLLQVIIAKVLILKFEDVELQMQHVTSYFNFHHF